MVWLSVIVVGFLLLGRLAQTLLPRCFEGGGPPCQLIEHLPGGLIEMLEFAQRLAVFDHGQVIWKQDVHHVLDAFASSAARRATSLAEATGTMDGPGPSAARDNPTARIE